MVYNKHSETTLEVAFVALYDDELNKRREERREEQRFLAKQQKLLRIGILITALTVIGCVAAIMITKGMISLPDPTQPNLEASTTAPTTQPPTTEPQPTVPDTVIHFVAGGDINVTDKTVAAGTAVSGYDFTDVFLDIVPVLGSGDITAVNFEGSLYGTPYGNKNASAPPQLLTALRNAGVDLVQAANSMTVRNGLSGIQSTLQGIRAAGLEPLGAYTSAEEFRKSGGFTIREIQGIKVAFVAFTKGMDGMGLPEGAKGCVNLLYTDYNSAYQKVDTDGITAILGRVEKYDPDVTVAMLHWGSEFNGQVSKTQEKIRDLLLENGVDAIIGTHSHYVQRVEFDAQKGTLVAYSLGDLLGDADRAGTDYTVLLDIQITKNGTTGKTAITGFDYTPVYISDETATGGGLRLLRMREAITAYEAQFLGRVSDEAYLAMKSALEKIESRMGTET